MKKNTWLIDSSAFLLLFAVIFLIYSSNLNGPFIFDDSRIQNNPQLHITELTPGTLFRAGFESEPRTRPVAYMSFALNYFFHGFETTGYHVVNIFIHALTTIFLYLFIRTTLNLPVLREKYGGFALLPIAASLIWAVHPLQTQSVTYIIQRMSSLAAMFYILAFYLYVKGRLAGKKGVSIGLFIGSGITGILALGSKETAVTLPFFIFLYEWFFLRDLDTRWLKKQVIPALLMATFIALLVIVYLGKNPLEYILASYGGRDFTLFQRILTESRVVFLYLSLLLFPYPGRLNLDHDIILSTGIASPSTTVLSIVLLATILFISIGFARNHRLISFSILWFLGNLFIESSVIGLEIIFEHRIYLPSMLAVLLITVLFFLVLKQNIARVVFLCTIVILFSFWTFERNSVWNNKVTLWGDCAKKSPAKARPHNNLGVALKNEKRLDEAIAHFKRTLDIDPQFIEAYNNLGNSYIQLGKLDEAIRNYKVALEIKPNNPKIHANLGNAFVKIWELEEALFHYSEALRLEPYDEEVKLNLLSTRRLLDAKRLRKRR